MYGLLPSVLNEIIAVCILVNMHIYFYYTWIKFLQEIKSIILLVYNMGTRIFEGHGYEKEFCFAILWHFEFWLLIINLFKSLEKNEIWYNSTQLLSTLSMTSCRVLWFNFINFINVIILSFLASCGSGG